MHAVGVVLVEGEWDRTDSEGAKTKGWSYRIFVQKRQACLDGLQRSYWKRIKWSLLRRGRVLRNQKFLGGCMWWVCWRLFFPCQLKLIFFSLLRTMERNTTALYEILGVPKTASPEEIKKVIYTPRHRERVWPFSLIDCCVRLTGAWRWGITRIRILTAQIM